MQSIKRRLSIILISCSVAAVVLAALFVNITVYNTFNGYLKDTQDKRNARIVEYFQEVYKEDGKWTQSSGEEMQHEAYMGNYCLTLMDADKREIWGMNPNDIKANSHFMMMNVGEKKGIYTSNTFPIVINGKTVGYVAIGQYSPIILSDEDINFKTSINQSIIMSVLLAIFVAVIISLIISRQFSSPISEVSNISVKLSKGDYTARSTVESNIRELSSLIHSINDLGERLHEQDSIRKRLVSDISHEIRTPLNVLQNNLEAMIDGIIQVSEERLNNLNEEVMRFGKLLDNLNTLKQFESDEGAMNFKTVFLDEIVLAVCEGFKSASKERNIEIIFKASPQENHTLEGDPDKLKQVFINLISNAIKFNREGGKVWVELMADKDKVTAVVRDNGMGIKKEDIPYIFERLYRGDKSRHEIEGSGIGLTIVKRMLILHSASIDVESEPDKGTKFKICFDRKI